MKKLTKKYIIYMSLAILILLGLVIGVTYAVFSSTSSQTTSNQMTALSCLDISFTSNNDSITLTNVYPMTDEEGLNTTPYNFTIKNNCSNYVEYYLVASVISTASQLNSSYVKVQLDGNLNLSPTVLTTLNTYATPESLSSYSILNNYILKSFSLDANESQTMNYRMWLDGTNSSIWTDETVENKTFTIKLSLIGAVKTKPIHLIAKLPANPTGAYSTTNTGVTWNPIKAQLEISSLNSGINNINLTNSTVTATNLANKIISLSGTAQGTGQVVNENGYRYEGKDPNNYLSFNGELWRIIGVFDSTSHGQAGKDLVKIIRENSIGGLAWHKSNTNDWPNSSLYHLLNDYYYNGTNETTPTYCYGYSTSVPSNCDFTSTGITNSTYRAMIQNVTWYLGGVSSTSSDANYYGTPASSWYTFERGTAVYSGRSTSTTGNIGLMYMSDYGYSVLSSSCARTTNMNSYNNSTCAGQSWLYGQGYEWTIVPNSSDSSYVAYVSLTGYAGYSNANYGYAGRPVLYLKSEVKTYGGDGTKNNPYIITM